MSFDGSGAGSSALELRGGLGSGGGVKGRRTTRESEEVRLSNSIKILEDPFYKCPQLEEIELPAKLENLIERTFVSCKKLKKW